MSALRADETHKKHFFLFLQKRMQHTGIFHQTWCFCCSLDGKHFVGNVYAQGNLIENVISVSI
jgi:hypothetical protein